MFAKNLPIYLKYLEISTLHININITENKLEQDSKKIN